MDALSQHPFPGNVRQLENLCHWLTVMAPSPRVEVDDLPPEFRDRGPERLAQLPDLQPSDLSPRAVSQGRPQADDALWLEPLVQAVSQAIQRAQRDPSRSSEAEMAHWERLFETAVYGTALKLTRGRRLEAAQVLQVGRNTITRKIQTLNLEAE
jgi:two-component system nitrogen regulation response regulator GlnG